MKKRFKTKVVPPSEKEASVTKHQMMLMDALRDEFVGGFETNRSFISRCEDIADSLQNEIEGLTAETVRKGAHVMVKRGDLQLEWLGISKAGGERKKLSEDDRKKAEGIIEKLATNPKVFVSSERASKVLGNRGIVISRSQIKALLEMYRPPLTLVGHRLLVLYDAYQREGGLSRAANRMGIGKQPFISKYMPLYDVIAEEADIRGVSFEQVVHEKFKKKK